MSQYVTAPLATSTLHVSIINSTEQIGHITTFILFARIPVISPISIPYSALSVPIHCDVGERVVSQNTIYPSRTTGTPKLSFTATTTHKVLQHTAL